MTGESRVIKIYPRDHKLLADIAKAEDRQMIDVLHRALTAYAITQNIGVKVPAKDIIPLYPESKKN